MTWAELVDPEQGFVKDGCVTFEAHITADAPFGVGPESKKHSAFSYRSYHILQRFPVTFASVICVFK
jgi:hypothetical protein